MSCVLFCIMGDSMRLLSPKVYLAPYFSFVVCWELRWHDTMVYRIFVDKDKL